MINIVVAEGPPIGLIETPTRIVLRVVVAIHQTEVTEFAETQNSLMKISTFLPMMMMMRMKKKKRIFI